MEVAEVWEADNWWSVGTPWQQAQTPPSRSHCIWVRLQSGEALGFERDLALMLCSALTH